MSDPNPYGQQPPEQPAVVYPPPSAQPAGSYPAYPAGAYPPPSGQPSGYYQGYPAQPYAMAAPPRTNTLAIVSLVTSIVGIGLAGVICGHLALSQIRRTGEGGRGLAIAGLVVGYVGIVLVTLYIVVVVIAVAHGTRSGV